MFDMKLVLRDLTENDEAAFFAGMKEWVGESPHWYSFSWQPGMKFSDMLEILRKEKLGIELKEGRVPHTMLYAFVEGNIIGRLSVRHHLNEHLRHRGGHIGYAVAKSFRQKGYAKEIVRQGLNYCKTLGLTEIMVTCADENTPSWKVIEHFSGRLQDKIWDEVDKEMIRRYWIHL